MKSISSYSLSELMNIKMIIEDEELKKRLYREIEKRNQNKINLEKYNSDRLPEFYEHYSNQCLDLLSKLSFVDVKFLINSSICDAGNNCGGDFMSNLWKIFQSGYYNIRIFDDYFTQNPDKIYYYEGFYNTLNYMKTYISTMLYLGNPIETKQDLFSDFDKKRQLVTENLRNVSEYLLDLRNQIVDSRLSVGNQALSKNACKSGTNITYHQNIFINSIAFGSTLEKLEDKNYEEATRLLFVPKCKTLKK